VCWWHWIAISEQRLWLIWQRRRLSVAVDFLWRRRAGDGCWGSRVCLWRGAVTVYIRRLVVCFAEWQCGFVVDGRHDYQLCRRRCWWWC
jgi:hypothetical protein